MYIDNAFISGVYEWLEQSTVDNQNGHMVLGRLYGNTHDAARKYGRATIDYLTIWDEPLSAEERDLVYQM